MVETKGCAGSKFAVKRIIASIILFLTPLELVVARTYPPSMIDYLAKQPTCCAWNLTFKDGSEKEVVFCPKTHIPYEARKWEKLNISKDDIAEIRSTGYVIPGVVVADVVAMIKIEIKQGKVEFDYPYDVKNIDSFNNTSIVLEPLDGDFIAYDSDGDHFSAWATFDNAGKIVKWHDPETLSALVKLPIPDADARFLYYRKQAVETEVYTSGGIARKDSGAYNFQSEGIEVAVQKFRDMEIKRSSEWRNSLLGGYIKYSNEFMPSSVRDPRKFYIKLKSGTLAFAMVHDDCKTLFSPISHAKITIPDSDIERFLAIDDGSYEEKDCYSAREVEKIYEKFRSSDDGNKGLLSIVVKSIGGLIVAAIFALIAMILKQVSKKVEAFFDHVPTKYGIIFLLILLCLYIIFQILLEV